MRRSLPEHLTFIVLSIGLLGVTACGGSTSPPSQATWVGTITIVGPAAVRVGTAAQYSIESDSAPPPLVAWSVSASGGATGTAAAGSIDATGLYTPPQSPNAGAVTITAIPAGESSKSASVPVQLLNPVPIVTSVTATSQPGFSYLFTVTGSNFVSGANLVVGTTTIAPATVSGTSMTASISMAYVQANQIQVQVNNPNPGAASSNVFTASVPMVAATITQAARILDQASFGATFADIAHVQQIGIAGYLSEQFAMPPDLQPDIPPGAGGYAAGCAFPSCQVDGLWTQYAFFSQDQLRQRVAFALSKIWTISYDSVPAQYFPYFLNILSTDAFGNWRALMQDITLSPAMGVYLNMANNFVSESNSTPNENYGRELMQVFTLGTSRLNPDGTEQLDPQGNTIPVYTQDQVQDFAKAFSGWSFANDDCTSPTKPYTSDSSLPGRMCAMVPFEANHDHSAKTLLDGVTLPASQSAAEDLKGALDDIMQDSNLPPFVATLLIQNLVESEPSPAYVQRVAQVFEDDGNGVRGNLQAVVQAILLDPEARAGDDPGATTPSGGRLRDPLLFSIALIKGLSPVQTGDASAFSFFDINIAGSTDEHPHDAPSVFGFYSPSYEIPGTSLVAPEFELERGDVIDGEISSLEYQELHNGMSPSDDGANLTIDTSASSQLGGLASQSPQALVDGLNILYFQGKMSSQTESYFLNALSGLAPSQMVRVGIYLVAISPEHRVQQ